MSENAVGVPIGSRWMHQNGFVFRVTHVAVQNDGVDDRLVVVHEGTHDGRVWVRDLSNFLGVHSNGQPRFVFVGS